MFKNPFGTEDSRDNVRRSESLEKGACVTRASLKIIDTLRERRTGLEVDEQFLANQTSRNHGEEGQRDDSNNNNNIHQ